METLYISTINILPEIILITAGIVLLIIGPLLKSEEDNAAFLISVLGVLIAFYLNFGRFTNPSTAFADSISLDSFSAYFNSIFLLGSLISIAFS